MSNLANKWTLLISFLVHIIFLVSIFDIYFKSPLITGISPVKNQRQALAKRLILFSSDGLRADSFFELQNRESSSSYLRSVIENRGRWGVGHAAVPTESRPGHVAIIAGFNEDPSAIFKGWKVNPVEFDSVFNQSVATFGWGSPDILLMFCEESNKDKIFMNTYASAFQDFSGLNGSAARESLWAFDGFKEFLHEAKSNPDLLEKLHQDGIIFFLHLLGTDTAGHSHKPHSEVYKQNIRINDEIVKQTEKLINEFYHDDQSVFLFTSDHGMSDWGSHGEASLSETEVPYVIWGSGILNPKIVHNSRSPLNWNLNHLERVDINQNDLAPLMSILLGIPIPVNSLGTVPLSILNCTTAEKSAALMLNAQQMLAQFSQKRKIIEDTTLKLIYKPFDGLADGKDFKILQNLNLQFRNGHYDSVINGSQNLIELCSAGLSYYHNYYQKLLLFCISFSYIGWICWLLLSLSTHEAVAVTYYHKSWNKRRSRLLTVNCAFIAFISVTIILLAVQCLPYQYYLYCCLPSVIWWNIFRKLIISHFKFTLKYSYLFNLLSTIIGTELVVISFFERRTLSAVMFFIMFWPLLSIKKKDTRNKFFLLWILSCISLLVFPFLPVLGGKPNDIFVILSTILWWIFIIVPWKILARVPSTHAYSKSKTYFSIFLILFGVALTNTLYVSFTSTTRGLSTASQFISWTLLLFIPTIPLISTRKLVLRLLYIYFALGIVSLLFSINHEAMFSPLFSFHLFLWFLAENIIVSDQNNHLVLDFSRTKFSQAVPAESAGLEASDLKRAFLFFYYTVLSFFGIGNIASINSFDPTWVRCFVAVFSPYTITMLVLVKIVIPFVVTACTFRAVNDVSKVVVDKIFLVVLIYCDIMGLNFLFLVKNVGSWLQIGSSVSHYVISQTITLFLVLLYFLSGYLTSTKLKNFEQFFKFNEVPSKTA